MFKPLLVGRAVPAPEDVMADILAIAQGDCGIRTCSVASQGTGSRTNTWAAVPGVTSLEDSGSEAWEFEPLSPSSTDSSEIPEAILEESSDEDRRPNHHNRLESDAWGCGTTENFAGSHSPSLTKPVLISAWTSAWMAGPPVSARETSGSLSESAPGALTSGAARTPVRRARVRGTLLLPTSSRELQHAEDLRERVPTRSTLVHSTTAPLLQPVPLSPLSRGLARSGSQLGEMAARRAEEALEAKLERQAREAADRQAILKALDDDRAVLAISEKQAQAELTRVQAELARVQAELSLRIAEIWDLKDSQDMLQTALSRSPLKGVCVCCLDAPATMAPVPCGHLALCEACVLRLDSCNCPVCRQPSDCIIHIFTP